jgi:hypothetical protein
LEHKLNIYDIYIYTWPFCSGTKLQPVEAVDLAALPELAFASVKPKTISVRTHIKQQATKKQKKKPGEINYRVESAMLFEAFLQKSRLFLGETKLLSCIRTIFIFIADSRRDSLYLNLLAAKVSLPLDPTTREG